MEVTQFLKEKQKMFQKYSLLQFGKITMRASNGFQKVFYGSSNILWGSQLYTSLNSIMNHNLELSKLLKNETKRKLVNSY